MKYKSWQNNSFNAWGGENASDQHIVSVWNVFIDSFDENYQVIPDYLHREIFQHKKKL